MEDRRKHLRVTTSCGAIQAQVRLPDGSILDGTVRDMSPRGVAISGSTAGLEAGQELELTILLPLDVRVQYRCTVKHVDHDRGVWGSQLASIVPTSARDKRAFRIVGPLRPCVRCRD